MIGVILITIGLLSLFSKSIERRIMEDSLLVNEVRNCNLQLKFKTMDNEITINGEVYVKKDKLDKCREVHDSDFLCTECPSFKNIVEIEKPWPQEGDEYFYIGTCGSVTSEVYNGLESSRERMRFGNFFQTKEEAQMYSLRIESLSKGFMPKKSKEDMWVFDRILEKPVQYFFPGSFLLPFTFPTKEECQEWYDKYGSSWLALLNDKK